MAGKDPLEALHDMGLGVPRPAPVRPQFALPCGHEAPMPLARNAQTSEPVECPACHTVFRVLHRAGEIMSATPEPPKTRSMRYR
ncbi:MAG: hypothetical protein Q8R28_15105 [Dehalococcoidia bacterium]|nr:hypothetical protein [Dehalococcoidia bacterium]